MEHQWLRGRLTCVVAEKSQWFRGIFTCIIVQKKGRTEKTVKKLEDYGDDVSKIPPEVDEKT